MTTISKEEFLKHYIIPQVGDICKKWSDERLQRIADDCNLYIVF